MSIYIFSRPIHSGKTSGLLHWCNHQKNIAGVLMPDIDGSRKIYDISEKKTFGIECTDPANSREQLTSVGRFHFYTGSFEKANSILVYALERKHDWLAIDEAGKLELEGKGFYSSIVKAVALYSNPHTHGNLLITVRDSLCEDVISFFNIKDCKIVHSPQELI